MKPVDLRPSEVLVVKEASAGPSMGTLGAIGFVVVAIVGVGAYFGLGHVNTLKEQSAQLEQSALKANEETTQIQAQIQELGQSTETDYAQIASNLQTTLASTLGSRIDYVKLEREVAEVITPGGWLDEITAGASTASGDTGAGLVTLKGHVLTDLDIAAVLQRVESAASFDEAELGDTARVTSRGGRKYWTFEISAKLVADETSGSGSSSGLVANGTAGSGGGEASGGIALEPTPDYAKKVEAAAAAAAKAKAATAKAAAGKSALELAADTASGGAS